MDLFLTILLKYCIVISELVCYL